MEELSLPLGFRFHPTDVELVMYFLKRKIMEKRFDFKAIFEIELYNFEPWDLPVESGVKSRDLAWFFFCSLDRKYKSGQRTNRATNNGFWKTTGDDKPILYKSRIVGMRKTLVFYEGKPSRKVRTDWVMHEYRLEDKEVAYPSISQDTYVVCKIFLKSGLGPKNGEQYGAPFIEEAWDDDDGNDSLMPLPIPVSSSPEPEDRQNSVMILSALHSGNGCDSALEPFPEQSVVLTVTKQHLSPHKHDDIYQLLFNVPDPDVDTLFSHGSGIDREVDSVVPSESIAEDADVRVKEPEDTTGHVEPNSIDKVNSPKHAEDGNVLCQPFAGFSEGCYLELNDLPDAMEVDGAYLEQNDLYPMAANGYYYGTPDFMFVHDGPEAIDSYQGHWDLWEPTSGYASMPPLTAGGIGDRYVPQSFAGASYVDPANTSSATFDLR